MGGALSVSYFASCCRFSCISSTLVSSSYISATVFNFMHRKNQINARNVWIGRNTGNTWRWKKRTLKKGSYGLKLDGFISDGAVGEQVDDASPERSLGRK